VNKRTAEVLIAELGADLETTMKMGAWAVFVLLLLAPSSVGSEGERSSRDSRCFRDLSECTRPCKARCRMYYPVSAFW
jgi:hypothetical protein